MSKQFVRFNRPLVCYLNGTNPFKNSVLERTMNKCNFDIPCCRNRYFHGLCFANQSSKFMCRFIKTDSSMLAINVHKILDIQEEKVNDKRINLPYDAVIPTKEAQFYHDQMGKSSSYDGTIYKDDPQFLESYKLSDNEFKMLLETKNWNEKSPSDVISAFVSLGLYACDKKILTIEDKNCESLISAVEDCLDHSTDNELINCLIALKKWPSLEVKDPRTSKLLKTVDYICHKRHLDWTIDKSLYVMDLWYQLGCITSSYYVHKGLLRISRRTDELTAAQMIQNLFYLSCKKNISPLIAVREYEYYIQQYITKLSIEEIGIFSLAFFKTKTSILNHKVLMYIMQRTVEEAETMDTIVLAGIAKAVRFSQKPDTGFTANDMVRKVIEKRWDSLSLITGIHLVHISTQIQFYDENSLSKLAEKFCENPSGSRLKDLERIAFFLSLYNYIPPSASNVCNLIVEQLDLPSREKEFDRFPLVYLSLVYFLSLLRVFPEKHIGRVLDEKKLLKKYGNKYNIPKQTVQLDYNRVLEGPEGSQHLLSPELREYIARRHSLYIPDGDRFRVKSQFDKILEEVMELSNKLLGPENFLTTFTLPHFPRADILFQVDDNGKLLPIPEEMKTKTPFEDVYRPVGSGTWHSVVIGGRNMYMHNVARLVGEQTTKIRQLKALGYTPIMIPTYYWKQEEDKMAYLKMKYFSSSDTKSK